MLFEQRRDLLDPPDMIADATGHEVGSGTRFD